MAELVKNPEKYFREFIHPRERLLLDLEKEAEQEDIPIVGPLVGQLLALLAGITQARSILELGTAIGYSTIFLARGCETAEGQITTIDNDPRMIARARDSFRKANLAHRIKLLEGDAKKKMASLRGPFDMIFLDIDKECYADVLPDSERLLKPNGLLVADNTSFEDARSFNDLIFKHPSWHTVQLYSFLPGHSPEHDGLCLATRL